MNRERLFAALCELAPEMPPEFPVEGLLEELPPLAGTATQMWLEATGGVVPAEITAKEPRLEVAKVYAARRWYAAECARRAAFNNALRKAALPEWRVHYATDIINAYCKEKAPCA